MVINKKEKSMKLKQLSIILLLLIVFLFISCDLSKEQTEVTGVSISSTVPTIFKPGSTYQMSAIISPSDATNQSKTWTSSDDAIATVNSGGLVTAVAVGAVSITVTTTDGLLTNTQDLTILLVGEIGPSGGYIFYDGVDDIPYFRYLEAAPVDISEIKVWGTYNHIVAGADGYAIGTGAQNTHDIIAGDSSTTNAAHACVDYSVENNGTTYDDWFLPSKDELDAMYDYLKVNDLGGFLSSHYWSSSENLNYGAWTQLFYDGVQANYTNNSTIYVRPVRAF